MTNPPTTSDAVSSRRSTTDFIAVAGLLVVVVVAAPVVAAVSAGVPFGYAWTRPLTGDEFHTLLLVEEPSIPSLISKLGQGGDYNPPGLYLLLRPWSAVFGTTEIALRSFSTVAMVVGLLGLYRLLCRGVSRRAALAATLAAWGGLPLLQAEAINARFYAVWFAESAWLAALLPATFERSGTGRFGIGRIAAVAALSALMCVTHYFGIVSLAAVAAGRLALMPFDGSFAIRTLLRFTPTLAGPAVLGLCIPLYVGQRAALDVPTWLAPSGRAAIEQLIDPYFRSLTLAGAALTLVASLAWSALRGRTVTLAPAVEVRPLASAFGLLALPIALLAFHFAVQPISVARYAIPAAVGVAAAAAVLLSCCERGALTIAVVVFVLMPAATMRLDASLWDRERHFASARLARRLVPQTQSGYPLVFVGRADGYGAWRYADLPADAVRIAFPDGQDRVSVFDRLERSVARRMNRLFGTPAPVGDAELRTGSPFVFCCESPACEVAARFPDADVRFLVQQSPFESFLVVPHSRED